MCESSNRLRAVCDDVVCRRLITVSDVGPGTALTFCTAVDDPGRFSGTRAVDAHFGATLRRYQSGEADRIGHINKQGDTLARPALFNRVLSTTENSVTQLKQNTRDLPRR
ncbi:transposase [Xanthobacter autotrophicus]|uniref:IS110 family transposase n=1 Tax=Xanthobacter autotrophicus TaxID=280 RepID=A0A6C1KC63_XANAU|nr:IS110 family transposase [Xanthobacter autotrophicus]